MMKEAPIHLGGCQNYGPFLGTLNIRCRILIGTQKGTIILTTPHLFANSDEIAQLLAIVWLSFESAPAFHTKKLCFSVHLV